MADHREVIILKQISTIFNVLTAKTGNFLTWIYIDYTGQQLGDNATMTCDRDYALTK